MSDKMVYYLSGCMIGVFLLDENNNVIGHTLFSKNPEKISKNLEDLKNGKEIDEVKEMLRGIKDCEIHSEYPMDLEDNEVMGDMDNSGKFYINKNMEELALNYGFVDNKKEFRDFLSKFRIYNTKSQIKISVKKDKVMGQAVSALEDIGDISNRFSERLREWYALYFPELESKIENNEKFSEIVSEKPRREDHEGFSKSMGIDLENIDTEMLKRYAKETKRIFELGNEISEYLKTEMSSVAPNVSHIAGPQLAAQLISIAGSLEDLAKMPSSTIQLLGAEKALFRHMKGKGKPPKYGVLYKHPHVQNASDKNKGKVARAIASKLMMAARTDFYTQEFKGDKYEKELEEKINGIEGKD
ncbi:MAG: NOP5/NOP56 family protein [Candidatus Aenigmatarchaeota archaeon]